MIARVPRIVSHLPDAVTGRVASHASRPQLLRSASDAPPWDVPDGAEVLLTRPSAGWFKAPAAPPRGWPFGLRWIEVTSTGVDWFPSWLFDGPSVTCGRGINAVPIAEYVLAAVLLHEKRLDELRVYGPADWRQAPLGGLEGKTLGLVGFGSIGRAVARRAQAFGLRVTALRRGGADTGDPSVVSAWSLQDLVAEADHLVLAVPLTPETAKLIDRDILSRVKPGQHLVNIARGGLIDQEALVAALDDGRLAAATLDVTDPEPLPDGHPLYTHPRVRLTPHVSWSAPDGDERLARKVLDNLDRYVAGAPLADLVDPARGY
ncbi:MULTISPECIES: D-isomer specific 2-hydroxyacid dehydrogenase family protein [Inquilinus]|uniref:Phosphoglycerate dehydrogenase-like enzyme n=1 Tax=Inquilinus ginsengisoli TaxID=363840 RepID=A0ABU1JKH4_9PROT|nr:D-isomer specific 2-hydroxyacid dehydrogenase family protein [Inquilinus ginsengisoli]MDR6289117.1 phosphoglycerate dehydrogenase-like enzyme [Inquilinus ginsengisoli]